MDWIDEEVERRKHGVNKPLLQSEHEAVNSRYPGCTLEYCSECGEPTGKAGRGEDSIFVMAVDGSKEYGPLCLDCHELLLSEGKI